MLNSSLDYWKMRRGADFLMEIQKILFEKWCFLRYFLRNAFVFSKQNRKLNLSKGELGEGVRFSQIASVVHWMSCEVLLPSCFFIAFGQWGDYILSCQATNEFHQVIMSLCAVDRVLIWDFNSPADRQRLKVSFLALCIFS